MARRILLADDSVTAQNMGRRILHDAGYDVTTVNNGSAALKKIAELKPDLIILDVYMPGYGGLEVCSRLKENRETQRTPVLLTVGKLEPFKPEEARRVRADAYIVKPFEASELLTALTKLEDKIVPGPEPYKPGRFAKALAAVEHSGSENDFGDQEMGWKERLIIPGGKPKAAEAEPEAVPAKGFRSVARDEDFHPAEKKGFERPMPAGLPEDISANEIEALAAAVAKISGGTETVPDKPAEVVAQSEVVAEAVAAPVVEAEQEAPAATLASAQAEEITEKVRVEVTAEPVAEEETVVAAAIPASVEIATATLASERPANDAEVLAALASLTPSGGDFSMLSVSAEHAATAAATEVTAGASFTGPRWVAESVAPAEEESTFLLEHEMEKAYAAFAAFEGGRAVMAESVQKLAPTNGNGNVAVEEPVDAPVQQPETNPEQAAASAPETVAAVASETVSPVVEESAYAAAASAGLGTTEPAISEAQPVASVETSDTSVGLPEEGSVQRESELAAAWANWRQIRESILGAEALAALPETLPEPTQEVQVPQEVQAPQEVSVPQEVQVPQEVPATPAVEVAQSETSELVHEVEDAAEISNIVDNMLAELKPKLMEEIKRKLKK